MDALQTALRPIVNMINRQIEATTPARELCGELSGTVVAVRVSNTALTAWCTVADNGIALSGDTGGEPDLVIEGSLFALMRLASESGQEAIRDGSVELVGDAEKAQKFQRLMRFGKPDLEEELSGVVGDAAAHGIGRFLRGVGRWGEEAGTTLQQNVTEYLQEESRVVPGRYEVDEFRGQVGRLRDDAARFEARLRQAEHRAAGKGAD